MRYFVDNKEVNEDELKQIFDNLASDRSHFQTMEVEDIKEGDMYFVTIWNSYYD